MDFWNSTLTEKSWKILQELEGFEFVLIGGWAAYLWTKQHKSKDIDIVLLNMADLEILKKNYDLKKNDHLKKYEISIEEIDIDIYVPYYSKLTIPVEELSKQTTKIQGFVVIKPEALLILKQGAEEDREHSIKGEKDRIDIMTILCFTGVNFKEYHDLLKKYKLDRFYTRIIRIISGFTENKYLDMTPRVLKLKKKELLEKLRGA